MKKTTNVKTTHRPHVKWGHLFGALAIFLVATALMILNFSKTILGVAAVDMFIAYGPLLAAILFVVAILLIVEDFLPSLAKFKAYKAKADYKAAVNAAIKESCLMNCHIQEQRYQKFLKENLKYRI